MAKKFQREISRGADSLAAGVTGGVVAVLEFPAIPVFEANRWKDVSDEVRELITGQLSKQRMVSVVERSQIAQWLEERNHRQALEAWTEAELATFGKEVGADYVVLGTTRVIDAANVSVHMRLVSVRTARVVVQATVGPITAR